MGKMEIIGREREQKDLHTVLDSSLDLQTKSPGYWMMQRGSPSWRSWTGHAFEAICLKSIESIKAALEIGAVLTKTSKWQKKPKNVAQKSI